MISLFRFEHNMYLWLLLIMPGLVWLFGLVLRQKAKTLKKIGDESLVRQLIRNYSPKRYRVRFYIVLCTLALLIIASANLQSTTKMTTVSSQGVDVMMVLDVSNSMLTPDLQPDRLTRAKWLIADLISRLESNRIGLVAFAGKAYLQMPLTLDHSAAIMYLNNLNPGEIAVQGTVIADALELANRGLDEKDKKHKTILLITDGEDHDSRAVKTAKQLAENGVVIHAIGTGTSLGAEVPDVTTGRTMLDKEGKKVVSKLDERRLENIARAGGGAFYRLDEPDKVLSQIVTEVNSMERKSINDKWSIHYRSFFQWFLALSCVGLIGEIFISERKKVE